MELFKKTAAELSDLLAKKEISAVELTKDVLARTQSVDEKVGGYITVAADAALAQAEAVDAKPCLRLPVSRSRSRTTSARGAR